MASSLVTARTAIKDRNNQVIAQTPPGALAELCGSTVEEFGRLEEGELTLRMMSTVVPAGYALAFACRVREGMERSFAAVVTLEYATWKDHKPGVE